MAAIHGVMVYTQAMAAVLSGVPVSVKLSECTVPLRKQTHVAVGLHAITKHKQQLTGLLLGVPVGLNMIT